MDSQQRPEPSPPAIPAGLCCPMCGGQIAPETRRCRSCGEVPVVVRPSKSKVFGCTTIVLGLGIVVVLIGFLLPAVRRAPEAAHRSQCKNNLKQIGMAIHNYAEKYDALPPAYTVDAQGKPLHSWRTLILPFLDQRPLYEKIDLSKPWNAPENAETFKTRVAVFSCPSTNLPRNHTTYLASAGSSACFHAMESRKFSDITDGTSNTLMVIEVPADRSVPWMSPEDADEQLILSIGGKSKLGHAGGVHAALCDGSVRFINDSLSIETRRALISIAGRDKVGDF